MKQKHIFEKKKISEQRKFKKKKYIVEYTGLNLSEKDYAILTRDMKYIIQRTAAHDYREAIHGIENILDNESLDFRKKLPENIIKDFENHKTYLDYLHNLKNRVIQNQEKLVREIKNLQGLVKRDNMKQKKDVIINYGNAIFDFSKLNLDEIKDIGNNLIQGRHYFNNGLIDKNIKILNMIKSKYGDKLPNRYFDVLHSYVNILSEIEKREDMTGKRILQDDSKEGKALYEKHKNSYKILTDSIKMAHDYLKNIQSS